MNTLNEVVPDIESRVADVRKMAKNGNTPDEILKYLISACELIGKAQLMVVFRQGFEAALKEVSCIGGWWIDGKGELADTEINKLLQPILDSYITNQQNN